MSLYNLAKENYLIDSKKVINTSLKSSLGDVIDEINELASLDDTVYPELAADVPPGAPAKSIEKEQKGKDYFSLLTKYIPTESITLYVAFMSSAPLLKKELSFMTEAFIYWFLGILTPVMLLLMDYGKKKELKKINSEYTYYPPVWEMTASFIAFLCWALAVPNTPYFSSETGGIVAAMLALFISTFLGILEPVFKK
ncbi:MAG: hypothetical protein JW995_12185 [Melioribacteraceae bacterium]|nr:hypothetical protein [Melioribacteraceae bacterium]